MFRVIQKAFSLIPPSFKSKLLAYQLLLIVTAIIEVTSVFSIGPFIALAANPDYIHKNQYLSELYIFFGEPGMDVFIIYTGILFLLFFMISNLFLMFSQMTMMRLSNKLESSLSVGLYHYYLHKDHEFHLAHKPSLFISKISNEVKRYCNGLLLAFLQINARVTSIILLGGLMFYIEPVAALSITLALSASYILVFFFTNKALKKIGNEQTLVEREKTRLLHESFSGLKYVNFFGLQERYVNKLHKLHKEVIRLSLKSKWLADLPYFLIETIALVLVVVLVIVFFEQNDNPEEALGKLAMLCLAGYRLLPKFQAVYRSLESIKKNQMVMENLYSDLTEAHMTQTVNQDKKFRDIKVSPSSSFLVEAVSFAYRGTTIPVFENVNLKASPGELVGIIGESGAGKSTLMGIMSGLLAPTAGYISYGDCVFDATNFSELKQFLGFVDSTTYIFDGSLQENITLFAKSVDHQWLEKIIAISCLDEVIDLLEDRLMTHLGNKSTQLSSGQLQRIGIARALYGNPRILLLDEATNALDYETQQELIIRLRELLPEIILIAISHRLDMRGNFDRCYQLKYKKLTLISD